MGRAGHARVQPHKLQMSDAQLSTPAATHGARVPAARVGGGPRVIVPDEAAAQAARHLPRGARHPGPRRPRLQGQVQAVAARAALARLPAARAARGVPGRLPRAGGRRDPGVPYVVFALVGLSVWAFFQASMTIGAASLITNFQLRPLHALPAARRSRSPRSSRRCPSFARHGGRRAGRGGGDRHLSPRVVLLPLGFVWLFAAHGRASWRSPASLAVRYRDIISALPFLLQVGLFLAPIGYPLVRARPTVRAQFVELNPLTGVIEAWRWMMLSGYTPSFEPIVISLVMTALLVVAGWRIFSAARDDDGRRDLRWRARTTTGAARRDLGRGPRQALPARRAAQPAADGATRPATAAQTGAAAGLEALRGRRLHDLPRRGVRDRRARTAPGKSTLLQILAGTTLPTGGMMTVHGPRAAAAGGRARASIPS